MFPKLPDLHSSKSLWLPVLEFLRMHRLRCILLGAMIVCLSLMSAVPPVMFQRILDVATQAGDRGALWLWLVAACGVLGFSYLLSYLRESISTGLSAALTQRLQRRAFLYLLTRRAGEPPAKGDLNALVRDSGSVASFALTGVPSSVSTVLSTTTCLVVALAYDPLTSLLALVAPALLYRLAIQRMQAITTDTRSEFRAGGEAQSFANQAIERLGEIKAASIEARFYHHWRGVIAEAARQKRRLALNMQLYALSSRAITDLVTLVVIIVGALRIYAGALSVSELLAIQMLLLRAVTPLVLVGNLRSSFERARLVLEVLARAAGGRETGRALIGAPLRGPVSLGGISFAHGARRVLEAVSAEFPARGLVAITGRNGAGKTSLMQVLGGAAHGFEGELGFDGRNMAGIRPRSLRHNIASVGQSPIIFPGTLRENLLHLARREVGEAELAAALASTGFDRDLASMPEGLETRITGFGEGLSGGQRQKLAITRALLSPANLLILDEPTSALDAASSERLIADLRGIWSRDRLLLAVTHDPDLVAAAAEVWEVEGGKLRAIREGRR